METKQPREEQTEGEAKQVEPYLPSDLESFFGCAVEMATQEEAVAALELHAGCLETINALAAENATLRAFVAAYDKNEAAINVKELGSVLVSNQGTREAVRKAREEIKL